RWSGDWSSDVCSSDLGPARWLFGGWQLNGIVSAHTGQAVTPLLSADFSNTGSGAYRPDIISDPNKAGPVPTNPDSSCAQTISQRSEERRVGSEHRTGK